MHMTAGGIHVGGEQRACKHKTKGSYEVRMIHVAGSIDVNVIRFSVSLT